MASHLEKESKEFVKLLMVMEKLRDPENGCPWDLDQTHQSIRSNLLEETYEALEALDLNNRDMMVEELGDVLFQIIFHSQIAQDDQTFGIYDVLVGVVSKLITRHPHVFGDPEKITTENVLFQWEQIKANERAAKGPNKQSILDGVPKSMPALAAAQSMKARASRANLFNEQEGFSAESIVSLFSEAGISDNTGIKERNVGDALFLLVAKADDLGIDAEGALREANERFRFKITDIERNAAEKG